MGGWGGALAVQFGVAKRLGMNISRYIFRAISGANQCLRGMPQERNGVNRHAIRTLVERAISVSCAADWP